MPVVWSGGSAVLAHNVALLAGLTLGAWAFACYAQHLTGSWLAGMVAGSLAAFNAHTLIRLAHVQAQHVELVPLVFVGLQAIASHGRARDAVLTGVALALQGLISIYLLAFAGWGLVCGAVALALESPRRRRLAGLVALALVMSAVCLLPVLAQYAALGMGGGLRRSPGEALVYSATWRDYLYTGARIHFNAWSHAFQASDASFPGLVAATLAVVALVAGVERRTVRLWSGVAIGAVLLSVAPHMPGFATLHGWLPPMQAIRAYSRAGQMALLAVAVLGGIGCAALQRRWPSRARAIGIGLLVLVNVEAARAPLHWVRFDGVPPVYDTLAAVPDAVVMELPLYGPDTMQENAPYMLASTTHWRPLLNGYSGFAPRDYADIAPQANLFPDPAAASALRAIGVTHVVLHRSRFARLKGADRLAALEASTLLEPFAVGGDIVIYRLR